MRLRPYQELALSEIRGHYSAGTKKVLLHLATGGGKTLIFCQILKSVRAKGRRAMIVVRGRKLIEQASQRLDREGVDHGVIMAGHWRTRPLLPIQVCSIDTLYSRRAKMELPEFDLVVIDEAHLAASASFKWLIAHYQDAYFLPVTATPHVSQGLRHIADEVVYPVTMTELITDGYLVPAEYYAPSKPDLQRVGLDRKTGDYKLNELAEAMRRTNLYGDMVKSYRKFAADLPTLLFCVSVRHSKDVCAAFTAAGIAAEHLDAGASDQERNATIQRLVDGVTKVVCNVGILTTGVDIPAIGCIILARPTKSYNLYVQILGRGTRPHPGKTKFLVLDHADAVYQHGFIEQERPCSLDGKDAKESLPALKTCENCFHIWVKGRECPMCGHAKEVEVKERVVEVDESYELEKVEVTSGGIGQDSGLEDFITKLVKSKNVTPHTMDEEAMKRFAGSIYHQVKAVYGREVARKNFLWMRGHIATLLYKRNRERTLGQLLYGSKKV